jgi:hypothetical protein
MTFFAPLLILVLEGERRFIWGCVVWGLMTAFRPSDGEFVLPWMVFQSLRFQWKDRLIGIAATVPLIAAWWIPTAERFGGGMLSPLRSSRSEVSHVAQGILTGQFDVHALVNAFHAVAGMIMVWGVLTPIVFLGLATCMRNATSRSMAVFLLPGLAFFLLYYVADAPYFAYTAAAGMILAGEYLMKWSPKPRQIAYLVTISASMIFMLFARIGDGKPSTARAVVDAYFLKYSLHSLNEQRDPRLASLLGACHDSDIRGTCQ